ncbi:hypothetical protein [Terrabacter sp. NPDC000476]|uniref:hypothetical protein n=1 Tax=Terrabacter sp. NPDC000476 TaxID=3154258 RepID=UPI00331DD798
MEIEAESTPRDLGHVMRTRLRGHNKGDLALAALTLSVAALAAGYEAARWADGRVRRDRRSASAVRGV